MPEMNSVVFMVDRIEADPDAPAKQCRECEEMPSGLRFGACARHSLLAGTCAQPA